VLWLEIRESTAWEIIPRDSSASKRQEIVALVSSKSKSDVDKKSYRSHVDGITLCF
jgi:hypothetical protein